MSSLAARPLLRIPVLLSLLPLLALPAATVRGESGRGVLLEAGATEMVVGDRAVALPPQVAAAATAPTAVTEPAGALAGLAWLDGVDRGALAVRWTPWLGDGWGRPETVAAPGPGSQLALTATTLDDGTPLLAWSRFDGSDDEIYWSRRDAAGWSAPARLARDNQVPDVTPALTHVPGGALAAWSAFDRGSGQYRVLVSRYDGSAWSAPRPVAGPGSLYPSFESGGVRPVLLYRTAAPRGWAVLELDGAARPQRRAAVATAPVAVPRRPVVDGDALLLDGARVALTWEELR